MFIPTYFNFKILLQNVGIIDMSDFTVLEKLITLDTFCTRRQQIYIKN